MLMRTCKLSTSPGYVLLPLGASHVWGSSFGLTIPWGSLQAVCSCWRTSLFPLPQNLVYLLLLFPDAFSLVSYTKPNLKIIVVLFPGLKPQILLSSSLYFSMVSRIISLSSIFIFVINSTGHLSRTSGMCKIQNQIGKDCLTSLLHLFELRKLGRRRGRERGNQSKEHRTASERPVFVMGYRSENKKKGKSLSFITGHW